MMILCEHKQIAADAPAAFSAVAVVATAWWTAIVDDREGGSREGEHRLSVRGWHAS